MRPARHRARPSARPGRRLGSTTGTGLSHAYTPDGRCVSLLKILLTNYCLFDCAYCINRRSSNVKRARFTVDEVVTLTIEFYKRNYIEGLFLSSGIIRSPDHTMEQMVAGGEEAAERARLSRLHPPEDDPGGEPVADRAGGALRRPAVDQSRTADAMQSLERLAPEKDGARRSRAPWPRCGERIEEATARKAPRFSPAGQIDPDHRRRGRHHRWTPDRTSAPLYGDLQPAAGLLLGLQPDPGFRARSCP